MQERWLDEWLAKRKRERRLSFEPGVDLMEEIKVARMQCIMDGITMTAAGVALIAALALLVHYLGWLLMPGIAGVVLLAYAIKGLLWFNG